MRKSSEHEFATRKFTMHFLCVLLARSTVVTPAQGMMVDLFNQDDPSFNGAIGMKALDHLDPQSLARATQVSKEW